MKGCFGVVFVSLQSNISVSPNEQKAVSVRIRGYRGIEKARKIISDMYSQKLINILNDAEDLNL